MVPRACSLDPSPMAPPSYATLDFHQWVKKMPNVRWAPKVELQSANAWEMAQASLAKGEPIVITGLHEADGWNQDAFAPENLLPQTGK